MKLAELLKSKTRSGITSVGAIVVSIAVGLILFATIGIISFQMLATAGTTSFQPVVVLLALTVVPVLGALAVALALLRATGIRV